MIYEFLKNYSNFNAIDDYLKNLAQESLKIGQENNTLLEQDRIASSKLRSLKAKISAIENELDTKTQQQQTLQTELSNLHYQLKIETAEKQLLQQKISETEKQLNIKKGELQKFQTEKTLLLEELNTFKNPKITENHVGNFIAYSNGTALDIKTGLMWCRFAVGQRWENGLVIGIAKKMNWNEAQNANKFFNSNEICGYKDWRVPELPELTSIRIGIDSGYERYKGNSLNKKVFLDNTQHKFWTNWHTTDQKFGCYVDFDEQSEPPLFFFLGIDEDKKRNYSRASDKNDLYCVRLVRG